MSADPAALLGAARGDLAIAASNLSAPGLAFGPAGALRVLGDARFGALTLAPGGGAAAVDLDAFLRLTEYERVRPGTLCNVHFAAGAVPELAEAVAPVSVGGTGGAGAGATDGTLVLGDAGGGLAAPDPAAGPRWLDGGLVLPAALRFEGSPLFLAPTADGGLAVRSEADASVAVALTPAPGAPAAAYVPVPVPTLELAGFERLSHSNVRVSWRTPSDSPAPPERFATCGYSESNRPRSTADVLLARGDPLGSNVLPATQPTLTLDRPHRSLAVVSESARRAASKPLLVSWGNDAPGVTPGSAPPDFASLTLRFSASNAAHEPGSGAVRLLGGALLAEEGGLRAAAPLPPWLPPDLRPDPARPDLAFSFLRSLEPLLLAGGSNPPLAAATVPPGGSLEARFLLDRALVWDPAAGAWSTQTTAPTEYTKYYRPFVLAVDGFDNAALVDYGADGFVFLPSADIDIRFPAARADGAEADYELLSTIKGVSGGVYAETADALVLDLGAALPRTQGVHRLSLSNLAHTTHYSVRLAGCNVDDSVNASHCNFRTLDVAPPTLLLSGGARADGSLAASWTASDSNDGEVARVHVLSSLLPPPADPAAALLLSGLAPPALLMYAACNNPAPPGTAPGGALAGSATLPAALPTEDQYAIAVAEDRAADLFGAPSNLLSAVAHLGAEAPRLTAAAPAAPLTAPQLATRHRNAIRIDVAALADATATGPGTAAALLLTPAAAAAFGLLDTPLAGPGTAAAHSNQSALQAFLAHAATATV